MSKKTKEAAKQRNDLQGQNRCEGAILGRPHLDSVVAGVLERGGVCLVAPDGMGKTSALHSQVAAYKRRGWDSAYLECGKADLTWILSRLTEIGEQSTHALICVDDIPACEEDEFEHIADTLVALRQAGNRIAIAIRPELGFLADALPFDVVGSSQMGVRADEICSWEGLASGASAERVMEYSHGVAALVGPAGQMIETGVRTEFDEEVKRLVAVSVRGSMMDEERRLRLAMLLLGRGTIPELEVVLGSIDLELLMELEREDPFYGLDLAAMSFSCAGVSDDDCLDACIETVAPYTKEWQELTRAACDELVRRDRVFRSGIIARSCLARQGRTAFVCTWPVELINSGNAQLVEETVTACAGMGDAFGRRIGQMALACRAGNNASYSELHEACPTPASSRERDMLAQVEALHAVRMLHCIVPDEATRHTASRDNELLGALECHVSVRRMLLEGRAHEAFRTLLVCGYDRSGETLTSTLLCEDFDIARTLVGDLPNHHDDAHTRAAGSFLMSAGMHDQMARHGCLPLMAAAMAGRRSISKDIDRCLAKASRRHDEVTQAYLILAYAVCDIRAGSLTRAVIRARRAREHAEVGKAQRAICLADLVCAVAESLIDGAGAARSFAHSCQDGALAQFAHLFAAVLDRDSARAKEAGDALSKLSCPYDLLPALGAFIAALQDKGEVLCSNLPGSWSRALEAYEHALAHRFPEDVPCEPAADEAAEGILRIKMLGELSVYVGGVRISESAWRRRASRKLLMLLVAADGHMVTRSDALEVIWPESDYMRGRGNLYTALSTLRKTFDDAGGSLPYIVGLEGYIGLNSEHVRCDVEEFSNLVSELTSEEHPDAWVVAHCRRIRAVYTGDLVIPASDYTGIFVRRRDELRRRYVDAMVLGAEAALRVGATQEAAWFAESACAADPTREDALSDLLMALGVAGRAIEARETYERYAAQTVERTGLPPSLRLRRVMEELAEGLSKRLTQEGEDSSGHHGISIDGTWGAGGMVVVR